MTLESSELSHLLDGEESHIDETEVLKAAQAACENQLINILQVWGVDNHLEELNLTMTGRFGYDATDPKTTTTEQFVMPTDRWWHADGYTSNGLEIFKEMFEGVVGRLFNITTPFSLFYTDYGWCM